MILFLTEDKNKKNLKEKINLKVCPFLLEKVIKKIYESEDEEISEIEEKEDIKEKDENEEEDIINEKKKKMK